MAEIKPVKPEEELLIPNINAPATPKVEEPVVVEETPVISEPVITESAPVEDIVAPSPEPEKLKIPDVIPETKVEEVTAPKVEVPKAEKVLTAEEIKANQLAIQTQEDAIKTADNVKSTAEFQNMLATWASNEELAKIVNANPDLRDNFNSLVRGTFKTRANTEYFGKYSSFTSEQLNSAVKSGDIVVWSEQYNLLPEVQRLRFEQYQTQANALTSKEEDNTQFAVDNNKTISLDDIVAQLKGVFSSDLRQKSQELLNTPEINAKAQELEDKQNGIDKINDKLDEDRLRKRIIKEYPWYPAWFINSKIRDEKNDLIREKNSLVNEYNSALGTYKSLKDNAQNEIDLIKYEDTQNKAIYTTALNMYETRRSEMKAADLAEFNDKNKQLAADTKFQRDLAVKEFEANLKAENKWGVYKVDRQGREIYVKDWVSTFVRNVEWEILFTETNEEYSDTTQKEEWVFVTTRSYKDWRPPEYFTYDVNGESSTNSNNVVNNLIANVKWDLQCGQAVNKYVVWQLGISKDDFWMWDSYKSKKKYINDTEPTVWGLAIWNDENAAEWKYVENWHTWIVTGYDAEKWTVQITDWNWNWDQKKSTHEVAISDIIWSDGWFYTPDSIPKAAWYNSEDTPLYKKFLEWKLTASDQKWITDLDTFKVKAEIYQEEKTKEWTNQIEKVIKLATDLRDNAPWRKKRIISWTDTWRFFSSDLSDYNANFEAFISNQALGNLVQLKQDWATFGALSDRELQFIQASATNLRNDLSDDAFNKELNRIIDSLKSWLSEERITELSWWITPTETITPTNRNTLLDEYNKTTSARNLDYLN